MGAAPRSNPNGLVLWAGKSLINGADILLVATGFKGSANVKTGSMLQTWILCAACDPIEALRRGLDVAICGGCIHRPKRTTGAKYFARSCYVNVGQAPLAIWRAWAAGKYRAADPAELSAIGDGRLIRLGAYGDPAAVPIQVWRDLLARAAGWTGYTHQSANPRLRDILEFCQVSADSLEDAKSARAAGVGSFRVLRTNEHPAAFETVCPASKEAGAAVSCSDCLACSGFDGASIAIQAHGIGTKAYEAPPRRRPLSLPVLNPAGVGAIA